MLIIKGLIIGIGKIIPGVSGSLLAISLGEYENMLNAVNSYFKDIISNSKYLVKICIGILTSIILFSNIIAKSIDRYYIYTMFLFAGFILGSNYNIKKDIKMNYTIIISSLIFFILINQYIFNNIMGLDKNFMYYTFGGIIDSISMIIPGIIGTALLISYGCYNEVIYSISSINLNILIPFIFGMIVGVILTIKFVSYMFNVHKNTTYNIILGISISTIIIMILKGLNSSNGIVSIILSVLLLIMGYFMSKKMTVILTVK